MTRPTCPFCCNEPDNNELLGEVVPEVWDGVLIWHHLTCEAAWPRFSSGHRHEAAQRILTDRNHRTPECQTASRSNRPTTDQPT